MMPARVPIIVVLAAGRGERFLAAGGSVHKLSAILGGKTVLAHTLDAAHATGLPVHVVHAAPHLLTMGDSIAQGVLDCPDAAGWLLLPADLPLIASSTIRAVADALGRLPEGSHAVRPRFERRNGHPVGFAASKRPALLDCKGKPGAVSAFIESNAIVFDVIDRGCVSDVDTPADLIAMALKLG